MPSELDAVRPGDGAPMTMSPLSRTMSGQLGLHINPDPGKEFNNERSPPVHNPGEGSRRQSIRQGSMSYQTYDPHASDPQAATLPYVNQATRPILNRETTTSRPNATQQNGRRDSEIDYGQAENNPFPGNAVSLNSESRRTSFRHNSIAQENQRRESNAQTGNAPGRRDSTAMEPVVERPNLVAAEDNPTRPWWRGWPSFSYANPKWRGWPYMLFPATVGLLIGLIVVLVVYVKFKSENTEPASIPQATTNLPQSSVMPITDSSIGAAAVVIGTYFSTAASGVLQTKVVYNDGKGNICIRTKSGADWLNVQCLEGANPRADTPLTVLDWLGGPSIYFITADNFLSGIDHMPLNDTWKFSTLRDQKTPTHKQSQLASVTWFNGTSSWLYYQDSNSQLREFGVDDYRDITWREGSTGPLGLALAGSGIGTSRWWLLSDGTEVLEVFIQVSNGAVHGRVYMESVWTSDFYAVDGTSNTVSEGAALTSTVIHQVNSTMVLLAYVSSDGYLTVQSRGTANQTNTQFDAFSTPNKILLGDGGMMTGIAAFDSSGHPLIYFVKNVSILEVSAPDVAAANWTTFDVTSA